MRNNAPAFAATTLVLGVFAAFLRWLQTMNLYDEATGLARVGAPVSIALLVYALLCAGVFFALSGVWMRRFESAPDAESALRAPGVLSGVWAWACAGVYVLCALVLMFTAPAARHPNLQRAVAAAAIFGGLCFPFLPQRGGASASLGRAAAAVAALQFGFWLVCAYIGDAAEDPVLWRCAPGLLALAATALAFCQTAGWFFGAARPRGALFFLQLAAFLDLAPVFDGDGLCPTLMRVAAAAMCLLLELLVVHNLKER